MEVFGGITAASAGDGSVAQVEALLLWVFVDVAAEKMVSACSSCLRTGSCACVNGGGR